MYYDKMHEIPVWLRTGSNPTDIIRFSKPYWKLIS